jgi:formiminoglutamase
MQKSIARTAVSSSLLFKGRSGDTRLGEWVLPVEQLPSPNKEMTFVIFGCADDKGVVLNRGRGGANLGPDGIRKHFYKMALPMDGSWKKGVRLLDFGNLIPSQDILITHQRAEEIARKISETGFTAVFLGGGHDFAAPVFRGMLGHHKETALINVDPHLDVREWENGMPHSGTPFRELLESKVLKGSSFVEFGARGNRNSEAHYKYCKDRGVDVLTYELLRQKKETSAQLFQRSLKKLASKAKHVAVTLDMDACRDAEGTSAAPVVGFTAEEMIGFAATAGTEKRVRYLEIAEIAPALDPSDRSSRIAAEILFAFLYSRVKKHA